MKEHIEQHILGTSGIQVSAIGLGCMSLGGWAYGAFPETDEAVHLVQYALDQGITFLDTADVYGPFTSEEIVGRAIKGRREQVVVATKGGLVVTDPSTRAMSKDDSPAHLKAACDASLRRLGIETIDLYQLLHRPDPQVSIEESVQVLSELVAVGQCFSLFFSNFGTIYAAKKLYG